MIGQPIDLMQSPLEEKADNLTLYTIPDLPA